MNAKRHDLVLVLHTRKFCELAGLKVPANNLFSMKIWHYKSNLIYTVCDSGDGKESDFVFSLTFLSVQNQNPRSCFRTKMHGGLQLL